MTTTNTARYDPAARFEVKTSDVEYRREGGDGLLARIYQPLGAGPFPALLDAHGGAWSRGDRTNDRQVNQALAESGLLVAAIDYRLAPQHPYPAQMQDINYGIRWLKTNAAKYRGDPETVGAIGSSSGGHGIVLSGLRPRDPRYAALSLAGGAPQVDAALAYVVAMWPIVDPYARYEFAKSSNQERLVQASEGYFLSVEGMQEGQPAAHPGAPRSGGATAPAGHPGGRRHQHPLANSGTICRAVPAGQRRRSVRALPGHAPRLRQCARTGVRTCHRSHQALRAALPHRRGSGLEVAVKWLFRQSRKVEFFKTYHIHRGIFDRHHVVTALLADVFLPWIAKLNGKGIRLPVKKHLSFVHTRSPQAATVTFTTTVSSIGSGSPCLRKDPKYDRIASLVISTASSTVSP